MHSSGRVSGLPDAPDERDALLAAIVSAPSVAIVVAVGRRIAYASEALARITGHDVGALIGADMGVIVHPDHHALMEQRAQEWSEGMYAEHGYRVQLVTSCGETRWAHLTVTPVAYGGEAAQLGTIIDITARTRIEDALRDSERRYRLLADHASDVIWSMDATGRLTYISPSVERLRGFTASEVMQQSFTEALTPPSAEAARVAFQQALAAIAAGEVHQTLRAELEQPRKDGTTVWTEVTATAVFDGDTFVGFSGISRDVSGQREATVLLRHAALHDALTGIANRSLLADRVEHAVAVARREHGRFAILYLDLDRFKPINDRFGHHAGDEVLREVSQRLGGCVRASDTIGRLGGDEFLVVARSVEQPEEVDAVVAKVRSAIERPYHVDGADVVLSCSVGVALYPEDGEDVPALLRSADRSMYRDKTRLGPA